jgi:L-malate glycosyltransferase
MRRIVFYTHTGQVSGAEKMLLLLIAHLPRSAFNSVLICPESGALSGAATKLGIQVYASSAINARYTYNPVLFIRYVWSMLGSLRALRSRFVSLRPDIIHANTVRAGIVATVATAGTGARIVWHVHDMLPMHPFTLAIRMLAYSSSRIRVVGCSAAAARTILPVFRTANSPEIIYNGCELDCNALRETARIAKRAELDISREAFAVGIVGQITPRKGQLELVHAFAEVKAQLPNAVLIICGAPQFNNDVDYLASVSASVQRLNLERYVQFLGYRNDAREVIGALDLCVMNSRREPFGLILMEAIAMGTPVVSTDSGGQVELIRHGVEGELVKFGDQAELVRTIVRLAKDSDLRERYRGAGQVRIKECFTREKYVARWCSFYADLSRPVTSKSKLVTLQDPEMQFDARGPR